MKTAEQADTSEEMWVKRGYKECRLQNKLMLSAWVAQPTIRKQILALFFAILAMALICYDTLLLHCKILSLVATGTKEGPVKIVEQANASKKMWVKRGFKECGL